jgi:hypothetical protein
MRKNLPVEKWKTEKAQTAKAKTLAAPSPPL